MPDHYLMSRLFYWLYLLNFSCYYSVFFFNDTATTEIYTLSLHDALPILRAKDISHGPRTHPRLSNTRWCLRRSRRRARAEDRKSTRLNSSHSQISYAVFCLKKKIKHQYTNHTKEICNYVQLLA